MGFSLTYDFDNMKDDKTREFDKKQKESITKCWRTALPDSQGSLLSVTHEYYLVPEFEKYIQ
jgi:hypothetical protein